MNFSSFSDKWWSEWMKLTTAIFYCQLYFGIMAGCPSRSPPAVAAPNKSASLNELVAPALCSDVHLTSPNLWLPQRHFFSALNVRVSLGQFVIRYFYSIWFSTHAHHSLQVIPGRVFFPFVSFLGLHFIFLLSNRCDLKCSGVQYFKQNLLTWK